MSLGSAGNPASCSRPERDHSPSSILHPRVGANSVVAPPHWKASGLACALTFALAFLAHGATNDPATALQQGLFEEEANHDLGAAIRAYQAVIRQFDQDRKLAATAVFRLGECYRKQGNTNEAAAQYERVLREFTDQAPLVALSFDNLVALGRLTTAPAGPDASSAERDKQERARSTMKRSLETLIGELQAHLDFLQRVKSGGGDLDRHFLPAAAPPPPPLSAGTTPEQARSQSEAALEEAIKTTKTRLDQQRKRLAELDAGPVAAPAATAGSAAARQEQRRLLQEEIKLVEKKLDAERNQYKVGALGMEKLWATEREVLELKRQAAALEAGPPAGPAVSLAARQEQKRLLAEEIILVEKKLDSERRRVENGTLPSGGVLATEQEILELKRQAAALDAGTPVAGPAEAAGAIAPTSAEAEEVQRIQAMIKDSPDLINARDRVGGLAPLHKAALEGRLVVAEFLLANGADVRAETDTGRTPLHNAAAAGHKSMVELLLKDQAPVQAADNSGNTPIHAAADRGYRSVVEVLLAHGADINARNKSGATPLHLAAFNGFKSVAEVLLARGANVDALCAAVGPDLSGSALHIAAGRGDAALAEMLIAAKADVNPVNRDGQTPLELAAAKGQVEVAKALLAHGAQVNLANSQQEKRGWTALHYAVDAGQVEVVALLLTNGADPNARMETRFASTSMGQGWTPLLIATCRGQEAIINSLLAVKADPNATTDNTNATPLVNAILIGPKGAPRKAILTALLDHGARLEQPTADGKTPLLWATWEQDKDTVELLLAHKANVNAQDHLGLSPLHYLWAHQNARPSLPIAELLLAAGADVNLRNNEGKTLLTLALGLPRLSPQRSEAEPLIALLRRHGALEDLPDPNRIQVGRPATHFSATVFTRGNLDWSHFTLLELLGVQFSFLASAPQGEAGVAYGPDPWATVALTFPDLAHVHLRRPSPDFKSWEEQVIDLSALFESGDCSKDVPLRWGDVVEVPEADHVLDARWPGFSITEFTNLQKCLTRHVTVTVKGQTTSLTLQPNVAFPDRPVPSTNGRGFQVKPVASVMTKVPYWIKPALLDSKLLLASSDLSRVKVTQTDPATGQKHEWTADCSSSQPAPDLWLRDGDAIEVPDKP